MSTSNRVRIAVVRETTPGTTPDTPRMRTARLTGESLSFAPTYVNSNELRSDRMLPAPTKTMQGGSGSINFELYYPDDGDPLSEFIRSGFFAAWTNTPTLENDGTADSVITDAGTTTHTFAVAAGGAAFVANMLVRSSGFANAGNNAVFPIASSTATTVVGPSSLTLTAETAPPGSAQLKVVGFQGASGDIAATATGLSSTTLDFTTLGLSAGMAVKIGGSDSTTQFATAADNGWARVTDVAAHALSLDNLPSGWATDTGSGKTVSVFFGDWIANGTTPSSLSIEKSFLDQTDPTHIVNTGMQVGTLSLSMQSGQVITGSAAFTGMGGTESQTALDASPDAASTGDVIAANANIGAINADGSALSSPNWVSQLSLQIANNLRSVGAIDSSSPVQVNPGECTVTGQITTYFGDDSILAKLYSGDRIAILARAQKDGQALVFQLGAVTLTSGVPAASAKNQDVTLQSNFSATIDALTNSQIRIDRLPYFES